MVINFLFIIIRVGRKVRLYAKLFDFFRGDSYDEFQEKTTSGEFFRNFVQTKAILYQNLWNFAILSEILFWVRIVLKKFTQVISYVVYT